MVIEGRGKNGRQHLSQVELFSLYADGSHKGRCDLGLERQEDRRPNVEFTNLVHSSATPELLDFLGKQGIPWEVFQAARKPISEAHNRQETPGFAKSIERHALRRKQAKTAG